MKFNRIWAIVLRHIYNSKKNLNKLSDAIYWPIMDLIIWGLSSKWIQTGQANVPDLVLIVLTGLVFWQVVWRSNYEVAVNLLEEIWNDNLANLFSTPLKIGEWVIAVMLVGMIKNLLTLVVGVGGVWILYSLNILTVGWYLLPFFFLLMVSGWFMGFIAAGLIVAFGRKLETMAWTMGYLFAPFSAVYYPLEALPNWAQVISRILPTTYIFEGMRTVLRTNTLSMQHLIISLLLNILYLTFSIFFFIKMFEKRRKLGFLKID